MAEKVVNQPVVKIKEKAASAARAESAPAPVRRYRAVLFQVMLIVFAGSFGVLTFLVTSMPSFSVDLQITKDIQMINFPGFASLMTVVSWPGFGPQSFILTAVVVLLIYLFGLHWEAAAAFIGAVFTIGINVLVKDLIHRPRPLPGAVNVANVLNSYSFPSGHVMFYIGFFGFIAFLVFTLLKKSLKRTLLLVLIGSFIVLIGVSRIYLGEHWASDVLGAYLLGTLVLVAIIEFYRWGKTRFFVHQPVASDEPKTNNK